MPSKGKIKKAKIPPKKRNQRSRNAHQYPACDVAVPYLYIRRDSGFLILSAYLN